MTQELKLISVSFEKDDIGQEIANESEKTLICDLTSVSMSERFAAAKSGLNPEYKAEVSIYDYDGERIAELYGERYDIYRTYLRENDDTVELYMQRRAGV